MTHEFQTKQGPNGNCVQAAIASILELPLSCIPDVSTEEKTWIVTMNEFLKTRGYQLVVITLSADRIWFGVPYSYLSLFIGQSESDPETLHAVVGYCLPDGSFQVEWNPAGDNTQGISTVDMLGLLIPLDPAAMNFMGMPQIILPSDQEITKLKNSRN